MYVDAVAAYCYRREWCGLSLYLSVMIVSSAETALPIEMLVGVWTWVGPRKHVLDEGAHWCHLANTTEPSICCGGVAFLRPPYLIGQAIYIFILWFLLSLFFFSSPNLSGQRLDVYHTSTHGVALV